jgi:hypothetical protein
MQNKLIIAGALIVSVSFFVGIVVTLAILADWIMQWLEG